MKVITRIDPGGCDCHSCLRGKESVALNLASWEHVKAMMAGTIENNTGATFTVRTRTVVTINPPGDDGLRWEYTSS